jgi:Flp pilus assembly protein TadG
MLYPSIKKFKQNERGSFTIEASLIFPIIFLTVIAFLFLSLYIYERVQLYQRANIAADRIAYIWDNTKKEPVTGTLSKPAENDGLYWRISDDNVLGLLFDQKGSGGSYGDLVQTKLNTVSETALPNGTTSDVDYKNSIVEKRVTVTLTRELALPSYIEEHLLGSEIVARGSATITDPVEFNRTVDLMIDYYNKIKEYKAQGLDIDKARDVVNK